MQILVRVHFSPLSVSQPLLWNAEKGSRIEEMSVVAITGLVLEGATLQLSPPIV